LLSNAALFVLPSDIEGLSLALLDAMGAGVCVLTSDIPENKEVVAGVGFTVQHGDRLDLERMLDFLLRSPDLRREAGAKGQRRIQDGYLWPGIARSIEAVYYDVLGWKHRESAVAEGSPKTLPRWRPLDIADVSRWDSWPQKRRERVAGRSWDLEVVTASAPSVESGTPGCEARHDIASGFD
jgi:hypothetical protein